MAEIQIQKTKEALFLLFVTLGKSEIVKDLTI